MIAHTDRVPTYPGRVKLIPVAGQENTYDLIRADNATQDGSKLNKPFFDEFLAASGALSGGTIDFALTQTGFVLADGALVRFKTNNSSLVATENRTLNVNNTGARPLQFPNRSSFGGVPSNTWVTAVYNATKGIYEVQMMEGLHAYGQTEGTPTAYTLPNPTGLYRRDGIHVRVKLHTQSGAAPTLSVGGGGAGSTIKHWDGRAVQSLPAGVWLDLVYSSSKAGWILQGTAGACISYGSYVGTGANSVLLNLSAIPKAILINTLGTDQTMWISPNESQKFLHYSSVLTAIYLEWNGTTVTWYRNSGSPNDANLLFNEAGTSYEYMVFF